MPRWIPDTSEDEAELLKAAGFASFEELFADIPRRVRMGKLGVGEAKEELDVVQAIDKILDRNKPYSKFSTFLGGRMPVRYIPAAVDAILSRSEFYTSYTPYQPEASQGMLQSLFEFQSLVVELTGMDVANASLYDGATAAGEALLLCRRLHEGHRFLIPASLPWEEKSVLANYAIGHPIRIEEIPFDDRTGRMDLGTVRAAVASGDVFGALADVPNGFGHVDEGVLDLKGILGEIPLAVSADPLALSVLRPPGDWGADVVVGEGQGFGQPPSFGGPLLGLFACRREHVRYAPGRIVGGTKDAEGRRAFTLTLQTREQHIRRSRATSNICTNQSLLALAFVVYASSVGPKGLAELQGRLAEKARTLASALGGIEGLAAPRFDAPYLSEFTVGLSSGSAVDFLRRLRARKVLGGHPLADPRPAHGGRMEGWFLTAATEMTTDKDIQKFAKAARGAVVHHPGGP
ncbi:MAG: aminomethyl-transferring glycine dehydrogenase subunit GcvPA [Thermoplasmata archaeon]|nr:aminomethyl-transferring glycine dehydrogenase subunit GcvPA [Thermoplasmata archaeon]MCI4359424.1 aminomethyl-transferring glycine dehydrogenase subunit GcvPA [Thermoplasmata archaeon]